jgi:hypothetical protein
MCYVTEIVRCAWRSLKKILRIRHPAMLFACLPHLENSFSCCRVLFADLCVLHHRSAQMGAINFLSSLWQQFAHAWIRPKIVRRGCHCAIQCPIRGRR